MKKAKAIFTSLLAVAMLVPSVASAQADSSNTSKTINPLGLTMEVESNDRRDIATSLSSDRIGRIQTPADIDYYEIGLGSLWTGRNITVNLQNIPYKRDYDLIIEDSDGRIIGRSSNPGNANETFTFYVPDGGGTYYARVTPIDGYSSTEYYTIGWIKH